MIECARVRRLVAIAIFLLAASGLAVAQTSGKQLYDHDCARCHGADGKGVVPSMRHVKGYRSVDLTQLSKDNDRQFPSQEVRDAIEGSKRFPAHLVGGMPLWGRVYADGANSTAEQKQQIQDKISALVNYIKSLQEN